MFNIVAKCELCCVHVCVLSLAGPAVTRPSTANICVTWRELVQQLHKYIFPIITFDQIK